MAFYNEQAKGKDATKVKTAKKQIPKLQKDIADSRGYADEYWAKYKKAVASFEERRATYKSPLDRISERWHLDRLYSEVKTHVPHESWRQQEGPDAPELPPPKLPPPSLSSGPPSEARSVRVNPDDDIRHQIDSEPDEKKEEEPPHSVHTEVTDPTISSSPSSRSSIAPPAIGIRHAGPPRIPAHHPHHARRMVARHRVHRGHHIGTIYVNTLNEGIHQKDMWKQQMRNYKMDPISKYKNGKKKRVGKYIDMYVSKQSIFIIIKKRATRRAIQIVLKNVKKHLMSLPENAKCEMFYMKQLVKESMLNKHGIMNIEYFEFSSYILKRLHKKKFIELVVEFDHIGGFLTNHVSEFLYE